MLNEIVTYEFENERINVSVLFTAKCHLEILTYYGLQVPHYRKEYYFITDNISYHVEGSKPFYVPYKTDYIFAINTGDRFVKAHLDPIGLGACKFSDSNAYSFCTKTKAYFSLISSDTPLELNKGESGYWQGYYSFVD